eukprot:g8343.t1
MRTLLFLLLFLSSAQAHWDDVFDPETDHITQIVHIYDVDEVLNTPEFRNRFRDEAFLETERLTLVPLMPFHMETLRCFQDPQTMELYGNGEPWEQDYQKTRFTRWVNRWDQEPLSAWVLHEKQAPAEEEEKSAHDAQTGGRDIGFFASYAWDKDAAEIAYLLDHDKWRQGYMSEAMGAILPYIQSAIQGYYLRCLPQISATVAPENVASRGFLEKFGFSHRPKRDKPEKNRLWYALDLGDSKGKTQRPVTAR